MIEVYRHLDWLDMEQAVDWLQFLVPTSTSPITEKHLLQLCESRMCQAYADVDGLEAYMDFALDVARGIHPVLNPLEAFGQWSPRKLLTKGDTYQDYCAELTLKEELPPWKRGPIFQPADIQALADKLNGAAGWTRMNTAELEALRQQLEQERQAREIAEAKVAELEKNMRIDASAAFNYTEFLRESLQREKYGREVVEAEVAALRQEIEDTYNAQQAKERDAEDDAYHRWAGAPTSHKSEAPASGLTFPYATKDLEAMHTAALKYWANHTQDKRQPTQKEVGHELCELLGLARQANNDPARKAIVLATAIKPDALMDA